MIRLAERIDIKPFIQMNVGLVFNKNRIVIYYREVNKSRKNTLLLTADQGKKELTLISDGRHMADAFSSCRMRS